LDVVSTDSLEQATLRQRKLNRRRPLGQQTLQPSGLFGISHHPIVSLADIGRPIGQSESLVFEPLNQFVATLPDDAAGVAKVAKTFGSTGTPKLMSG
jgi:hypothetical protein